MADRLPRSEHCCEARLLGGVLAAAIAGALTYFAPHAGAQDCGQSGPPPAFEVASVKLHVSGSGGGDAPGRFAGTFTLAGLIMRAYGLQAGQQLAAHEESRIMPVYELTVGKNGPKMKEVDPSKFKSEILRFPPNRGFRGHLTMPQLAYLISDSVDRYVLDSTGLKGIYDVDVRWTPVEENTLAGGGEHPPVASEPSGLFRAIQDQLGLKLESRRAPVKLLIVDHVERVPTAN